MRCGGGEVSGNAFFAVRYEEASGRHAGRWPPRPDTQTPRLGGASRSRFGSRFGSRAKSLRTYRSACSNDRSALTRRPRDAAYLDEPVRAQVVVHERGHLALRHRAGARRRGLVPARRHRGARRESGSAKSRRARNSILDAAIRHERRKDEGRLIRRGRAGRGDRRSEGGAREDGPRAR